MRILHLGKFYSPIEGGIESINKFVVDTLITSNTHQRILSFNREHKSIEDDVEGIPVIRASTQGVIASQPVSIKYFWELRRNLRMFKPDIVHFHYPNPLVALYLLLNRKKFKLIVHWHSDIVAQKILYHLIIPIEKRLLNKADCIIATSPNYRDASVPLLPFKDKVKVIPCSINETNFDLDTFDKNKVEDIKSYYGDKPIVFFIGRHVEYKGIRYLLEAEKYVNSDCVFLIAGRGPLTEDLQRTFQSKRIHWLGRLSDEEMKLYYSAASIFAFPSITKNEAFGVVLAESMYCGAPAVTFSIEGSGVNWVSVKDETCLEVANRDSRGYAEAIDRMLSDKALHNRLKEKSKIRVNQMFTKHAVAQKYLDLYKKLLS